MSDSRPRLLSGVTPIVTEDGVILEGLAQAEMVRGLVAQTVLPRLLELLDGEHPLAEILSSFPGIPPEVVLSALESLRDWHLVSDAPAAPGPALSFLQRSFVSQGLPPPAPAALEQALRASRVTLAAPPAYVRLAKCLGGLFEAMGVPGVDIGSGSAENPRDSSTLTIAIAPAGDALLWQHESRRLAAGGRWLRLAWFAHAQVVDVGPLFEQEGASCYRCFHCSQEAPLLDADSPSAPEPSSAWLSFAAMEILALLVHLPQALGGRGFRRFRVEDWHAEKLSYPRLTDCTARSARDSGLAPGGHKALLTAAAAFDSAVALEVRRTAPTRQPAAGPEQLREPAGSQKVLLNSRLVTLPQTEAQLGSRATEAIPGGSPVWRSLDIATLGSACALGAGMRSSKDGAAKRWAASGGNLGSPEVYLLARAVSGLESGLYFYQASTHTLADIASVVSPSVDQVMSALLGEASDLPDALLVFSGAFHRLRGKYGAFGYKLLHLDAGSAAAQITMLLHAMGMHVTPGMAPRKRSEDLLRLASGDEHATLCLAVRGARTLLKHRLRSLLRGRSPARTPEPGHAYPAAHFCGKTAADMLQMLVEEPVASLAVEPRSPANGVSAAHDLRMETARALPPPERYEMTVATLLRRRRSVRSIEHSSLSLGEVATALQLADACDAADWSEDRARGERLRIFLLATAVAGLAPGVYQYLPGKHSLVLVRSALERSEADELFAQEGIAAAPCVCWFVGVPAASLTQVDSSSYRRLLVRAGASAQRWWMTLIAAGREGSLIAGIVPGAANRLLPIDPTRELSLLAVVGG